MALQSNTSGSDNIGIGYQSGISITEGIYNTCIGNNSNITGGANYSTAIGYNATASASNSTAIGCGATTTLSNSTAIGYGATSTSSDQIVLGTSSNSTSIPGSLNVDSYCTVTSANVNQTLSVAGTSTFTSGFKCGNQSTPYIMLMGTASVAYGGNAIDAYASGSQNTCIPSVCTLNNSMSFPTSIVGGYANTNYQYIFANFISSYNGSTNQIYVSFVNLGQGTDYIPSTISFILWGQ